MLPASSRPAGPSAGAVALMVVPALLALIEGGFDHRILNWTLALLALVAAREAAAGRLGRGVNPREPLFWLFLFTAWGGLSLAWSISPHRTVVEFFQVALYLLIFALASTLPRRDGPRLARLVLVTALGTALLALLLHLLADPGRASSTLGNANVFAIYLAMVLLVLAGYILHRPRPILAAGAIVLGAAMVLTLSRGAALSLVLALPLLFRGLSRERWPRAALTISALILGAFLLAQALDYLAGPLQAAEGGAVGTTISEAVTSRAPIVAWSGVSRLAFWEAGLRAASQAPLAGSGLGTFYLAYLTVYSEGIWFSRFVHNHYIQVLAELGLVGALFLGGFLVTIILRLRRLADSGSGNPPAAGLAAAFLAFLLHLGMDFSWNFPGAAVLFFIIAGRIAAKDDEESPAARGDKQTPSGPPGPRASLPARAAALACLLLALAALGQLYAYRLYEAGIYHDRAGQPGPAAALYDRANSFYPLNPGAYSFASDSYYRLYLQENREEDLEKALARARRAVSLSPVDATLLHRLGLLYVVAGRAEEAETHLLLAERYAGYRLQMSIDLARFYLDSGRFSEALAVIDTALARGESAFGMHPPRQERERVKGQLALLEGLRTEAAAEP